MIDISTFMRGCVSGGLVTLAWFAQKVLLHILSPTVVHGTGLNQNHMPSWVRNAINSRLFKVQWTRLFISSHQKHQFELNGATF